MVNAGFLNTSFQMHDLSIVLINEDAVKQIENKYSIMLQL